MPGTLWCLKLSRRRQVRRPRFLFSAQSPADSWAQHPPVRYRRNARAGRQLRSRTPGPAPCPFPIILQDSPPTCDGWKSRPEKEPKGRRPETKSRRNRKHNGPAARGTCRSADSAEERRWTSGKRCRQTNGFWRLLRTPRADASAWPMGLIDTPVPPCRYHNWRNPQCAGPPGGLWSICALGYNQSIVRRSCTMTRFGHAHRLQVCHGGEMRSLYSF